MEAIIPECQREDCAHLERKQNEHKEIERLRAENEKKFNWLKQELRRKERALAEAAALSY